MSPRHEGRSSDEIRRDIERTRAEMDETVDALGDRFSPGQLVDQAWGIVRRQKGGVGDVARQHPVPLALMGLGVAWLAIEQASGNGHRSVGAGTYERAEGRVGPYRGDEIGGHDEGTAEKAKHKLSDAAGDAKEKVSGARHKAGDAASAASKRAHEGADRVRTGARRRADQAKHGFDSLKERSPLALGAISFGLGMASGLAAPTTHWEDEVMGEKSDALKERTVETARRPW